MAGDGIFGGISHDEARQERSNAILRDFAVAIIRDRPLEVTQLVLADFLRYFRPGVASKAGSDVAITLPARPRAHDVDAQTRDRYVPDFVPAVQPPATPLRAYQAVGHTPHPRASTPTRTGSPVTPEIKITIPQSLHNKRCRLLLASRGQPRDRQRDGVPSSG